MATCVRIFDMHENNTSKFYFKTIYNHNFYRDLELTLKDLMASYIDLFPCKKIIAYGCHFGGQYCIGAY